MKMMRSTSMTSTNGVTLISAIGEWRRVRLAPARASDRRCGGDAHQAAWLRSSICRDRIAANSSEKPSMRVAEPRHLRGELVVEHHRGNRGEQPERGGEQRLGDAGRDHGKVRVLRGGDRLERRHDAPDRAEQADEGAGRADRGEHQEPALEPVDLAGERHVHHPVDAAGEPVQRARARSRRCASIPASPPRRAPRRRAPRVPDTCW